MSLMLGKMSEKKVKNKTVNSRNAFIGTSGVYLFIMLILCLVIKLFEPYSFIFKLLIQLCFKSILVKDTLYRTALS